MLTTWLKAQWFRLLTNGAPYTDNTSLEQWRRRHSRVLVRQILSSLKLQPVALIAEGLAAILLVVILWDEISHPVLVVWVSFVALHLYGALDFNRRFWADRYRHARIHFWMRTWMLLAVVAGLIWAFAGVFFAHGSSAEPSQILLIAVILTVTFASWPIYACWLPSLGVFTLLSVTPLVLRLALMFGLSRLVIALLLVCVVIFIFYSGRRFNDIVQMSVRNDQENEELVKRLTLEKKLAEKLRRETQEQSRLRARFFAAANHDIRQPLQAIGIYIQLLQQSQDAKTRAVVEQLAKTTSALQTLVAQILEVSRLEAGHINIDKQPLKLQTLLEDLAMEFEPIAKEKGLSFTLKNLDVIVYTDAQLLSRAIRNLITNAINYTNSGGVILAARLIANKTVSICVVDSGAGIEKSEQKRIFESFYRSHATRDTVEGYGLGLSIVKVICEQLGMRLSASSRLGRGSIFRIDLPVHEAEQASLFTPRRSTGGSHKTLDATVALVDDNAMVRDSLSALLSSWGVKVISAAGLTEAFVDEVRLASKLDAVISDFNLGDNDPTGLEVLLAVSKARAQTVPAILLTAVHEDLIQADYVRQLRTLSEADAKLFAMPRLMQKPVSAEDLNEALREILGLQDNQAKSED